MEYVVYCDESRHEGPGHHTYMSIGGLWVPRSEKLELTRQFRSLCRSLNLHYRKDKLDLERVKRIRWIKEIIAGQISGTGCWLTPSPSGGGRLLNRLYVLLSDSYVIWLELRLGGGWKFSTAYKARLKDVQRYYGLGKRIWVQK